MNHKRTALTDAMIHVRGSVFRTVYSMAARVDASLEDRPSLPTAAATSPSPCASIGALLADRRAAVATAIEIVRSFSIGAFPDATLDATTARVSGARGCPCSISMPEPTRTGSWRTHRRWPCPRCRLGHCPRLRVSQDLPTTCIATRITRIPCMTAQGNESLPYGSLAAHARRPLTVGATFHKCGRKCRTH